MLFVLLRGFKNEVEIMYLRKNFLNLTELIGLQ